MGKFTSKSKMNPLAHGSETGPNSPRPQDHTIAPKSQKIRRLHLIGICGTGMGTLAAMLQEQGYVVQGSDQGVYPPMSTLLAQRRIPVFPGFRPENLEPRPDLVIIGNVIRRDNPEAAAVLASTIPYLSMPAALDRFFLRRHRSIVVAGTHGKTTTTGLVGWTLTAAGLDPGCLAGGILTNFRQSYRLGRGEYFVVEGDEYDTAFFDKNPKFLHYHPEICILTSVEYDHADIYADIEAVSQAFSRLLASIPPHGLLLVNGDDCLAVTLAAEAACRVVTYGFGATVDFQATEVALEPGATKFSVRGPGGFKVVITSSLAGRHNVANATAAVALAALLELPAAAIRKAIATFAGVHRRQEIRGEAGGILVVDDFAHHPTAVRATIEAMKPYFGGRRLWAIFEPRTNSSRRAVFQQEYVQAFDGADRILIKEPSNLENIPPAERFSTAKLVGDLRQRNRDAHCFAATGDLVDFVCEQAVPGDVVLVMSTGAFDNIHQQLLAKLANR